MTKTWHIAWNNNFGLLVRLAASPCELISLFPTFLQNILRLNKFKNYKGRESIVVYLCMLAINSLSFVSIEVMQWTMIIVFYCSLTIQTMFDLFVPHHNYYDFKPNEYLKLLFTNYLGNYCCKKLLMGGLFWMELFD